MFYLKIVFLENIIMKNKFSNKYILIYYISNQRYIKGDYVLGLCCDLESKFWDIAIIISIIIICYYYYLNWLGE